MDLDLDSNPALGVGRSVGRALFREVVGIVLKRLSTITCRAPLGDICKVGPPLHSACRISSGLMETVGGVPRKRPQWEELPLGPESKAVCEGACTGAWANWPLIPPRSFYCSASCVSLTHPTTPMLVHFKRYHSKSSVQVSLKRAMQAKHTYHSPS